MESEKEGWLRIGEGSTVLPSHGGVHRGNIKEGDRGERTERLVGLEIQDGYKSLPIGPLLLA
jgi:hypothetical protein